MADFSAVSTACGVIHGRLNSLMWNRGHSGVEDGKELHKRGQTISLGWIFSTHPPATRHSRVTGSRGHSRGHLRDKKGQRPTAELKPGIRPDEEVPEPRSAEKRRRREVGRGAVENFQRIADSVGCCEMKTKESVKLCSREVISDLC